MPQRFLGHVQASTCKRSGEIHFVGMIEQKRRVRRVENLQVRARCVAPRKARLLAPSSTRLPPHLQVSCAQLSCLIVQRVMLMSPVRASATAVLQATSSSRTARSENKSSSSWPLASRLLGEFAVAMVYILFIGIHTLLLRITQMLRWSHASAHAIDKDSRSIRKFINQSVQLDHDTNQGER